MSVQTTTSVSGANPDLVTAARAAEKRSPVQSANEQKIAPETSTQTREDVEIAAKKTQEFVQALNSSLQFAVDDTTGVTVVKVIDDQTHETIRQIPSEEMLEIARALDRLNGLLIKSTA